MFLPCHRWIGIAALLVVGSHGFLPHAQRAIMGSTPSSSSSQSRRYVINDLQRPPTFLDDGDDASKQQQKQQQQQQQDEPREKLNNRWQSLNPKLKERLIERGQAKAISNKQKREPASDKKRRVMMQFKKLQQEKKLASRVERPLGFDERTPLAALLPGMELTGLVISLTKFGAYVDIGTETDGLLHVSQITRDFFVEHPRQVLTPGEEVLVKVRSTNPSMKKLHLTMLNVEDLNEELQLKMEDEEEQAEERIELSELQTDDELWGQLKRVTDFGAYVEVGAEVDGFLHFMDHPSWEVGMPPSEFMTRGDRVRVWVADVNTEQRRMKLTANRPGHLPGPRREVN